MDEATADTLATHLTGLCVESVDSNGGHLQIAFQRGNLSVLSTWRFSRPDWVVGNSSAEDILLTRLQRLINATVVQVDVVGELNDLSIRLGNDYHLETFANSGEYENWSISFSFETTYVGGSGRSWSAFIKGQNLPFSLRFY
jgi:hypothetical protein